MSGTDIFIYKDLYRNWSSTAPNISCILK